MSGDGELLEEVMVREQVLREANAPWDRYAVDLRDWISAFMVEVFGGTSGAAEIAGYVSVVLTILGPLVALFVVRHRLRAWVQPWLQPPPPAPSVPLPSHGSPTATLSQAQELVAAGRVREALPVLWLAVCCRLEAAGVLTYHPAMTNREVLALVRATSPTWAHHEALAGLSRALERLAYGPGEPSGDRVTQLAADAEAWA